MKVKLFVLIGLITSIQYSQGQLPSIPATLSLEEARQLAIKNNPTILNSNLNIAISQKQVEEARWKKIPQVYTKYDIRSNLIIPTTPVPARAFDPAASENVLLPLKFASRWSSNIGLNAHYDLFNPQTRGAVREAEHQTLISTVEAAISASDLQFAINLDYVACIIAGKQVVMAALDTAIMTRILSVTSDRYKAGRSTDADINNAMANKNRSVSDYFRAENILAQAGARLLTDLGLDPAQSELPILTDSIPVLMTLFAKDVHNAPEPLHLQRIAHQQALSEIRLQNTRDGFLPTVSLNGFLGANYYDNGFNIFNESHWYGNSYLGLSVTIPITQGLDRIKKADVLKLQILADRNRYLTEQNQHNFEVSQARNDYLFRKRDLDLMEQSMELASKNFKLSLDQFKEGRVMVSELSTSELHYRQAKAEYLQAAYDLIVAGMRLEKAIR